ncbi:MAG: NapC/NirT family cytochrome c [Candidatus Alcyoniella australis]|nr:NapC/NirT family cytochrome c [Candidatus Alcyoniella australis]
MSALRRVLDRAWALAMAVNPFAVFAGLLLLGVVGLSAMVQYNQANDFCLKCHHQRGPYQPIDLESTAHEPYVKNLRSEAHVNCLECHTDKELINFFELVAVRAGRGFDELTNPPRMQAPREGPQYADELCLRCHYKILETDEIKGQRLLELSDRLRVIGLRFSHQRHFQVRAWTPELERRLEQINLGQIQVEHEELEFLQRARLGHCAQCHDRFYADPSNADKNVNLYTSNPMSCAACHLDADPQNHPGKVLGLPSERSCRRCHNGVLHGRMRMFLADMDSEDKQPCVKCHPAYMEKPPIVAEDET